MLATIGSTSAAAVAVYALVALLFVVLIGPLVYALRAASIESFFQIPYITWPGALRSPHRRCRRWGHRNTPRALQATYESGPPGGVRPLRTDDVDAPRNAMRPGHPDLMV